MIELSLIKYVVFRIKDTTDLSLEIDNECWMISSLYDRRDVFEIYYTLYIIALDAMIYLLHMMKLLRCWYKWKKNSQLANTDEIYSRNTAWAVLRLTTFYQQATPTWISDWEGVLRNLHCRPLSRFGWSMRNIDPTEVRIYVPLFGKLYQRLSQPLYSIGTVY
jgi:hypothetical protein